MPPLMVAVPLLKTGVKVTPWVGKAKGLVEVKLPMAGAATTWIWTTALLVVSAWLTAFTVKRPVDAGAL
jgi:hypothetical protein